VVEADRPLVAGALQVESQPARAGAQHQHPRLLRREHAADQVKRARVLFVAPAPVAMNVLVVGVQALVERQAGAQGQIGFARRGSRIREQRCQRSSQAFRLRRVRIDTFGVGVENEEAFGQFLRQLADENSGSFTEVR